MALVLHVRIDDRWGLRRAQSAGTRRHSLRGRQPPTAQRAVMGNGSLAFDVPRSLICICEPHSELARARTRCSSTLAAIVHPIGISLASCLGFRQSAGRSSRLVVDDELSMLRSEVVKPWVGNQD